MAGVFFAFSISVMSGLAKLPPAEGIAAMQAINVAIVNPVFLIVFLGTTIGCLVMIISGLRDRSAPGAMNMLIGGLLYVVGSMLVTAIFNIPKNNQLATVNASETEGLKAWSEYLMTWTIWNHVRGVAALLATALLALGVRG